MYLGIVKQLPWIDRKYVQHRETCFFGEQTAGKGELPVFDREEQKELYIDHLAIENVFLFNL